MSTTNEPTDYPTHSPKVNISTWYTRVEIQVIIVSIISIIILSCIIYFYIIKKRNEEKELDELRKLSTTVVINMDDDDSLDSSEDSPLLSDIRTEKFDSYRSKNNNNHIKSFKNIHNNRNSSYFNIEDLNGGPLHDMQLKSRFHSIMATGVIVNLHTSKGPRPIILTLIYDEIRWQAVTNAKKKYKLSLYDVINVEAGKKSENLIKNKSLDESKCFSIITSKTSIDLEVNSLLDRDCFVLAMNKKIIEVKEIKK